MKRKALFFVALLAIPILCCLTTYQASADSSNASILKKWSFTGAYQCIRGGNIATEINTINKKVTVNGNSKSYSDNDKVATTIFPTTGTVYMPSYAFAGTAVSMNCQEMIVSGKYGSDVPATLSYHSANDATIKWNSPSGASTLLKDTLKYNVATDSTGGTFKIGATLWDKTCSDVDLKCDERPWTQSSAASVVITAYLAEDGTRWYKYDSGWANFWNDISIEFEDHKLTIRAGDHMVNWASSWVCKTANGCSESFDLPYDIKDLYNEIESKLGNTTWALQNDTGGGNSGRTKYVRIEFKPGELVNETSVTGYSYNLDSSMNTIKAISSNAYLSARSFKFVDSELFNLYSYYVEKAALASGSATAIQCDTPSSTTGLTPVQLLDSSDKKFKTCYVNFNGVNLSGITVYTQGYDSETKLSIIPITMDKVVEWLNALDTSNMDPDSLHGIDGSVDINTGTESTGSNTTTDACMKGGAAESLGWILCPILGMTSDAVQGLYDSMIEPFLEVESGLVGSNGTLAGWQVFQNFANVAAVILLLVIIFSQVTGLGIDNYGIKKIMPKFIVAMVLINLSFIICQFAVDVSNIAGKGLKDMFDNLGGVTISSIEVDDGIDGTGEITVTQGSGGAAATAVSIGVIGMIIGALVAFPGIALMAIPSILLALLSGIVTAFVAILVLFVLLTIRKVAVIVLVVISPLAFALYMLPNTKKLFDKWLSFFKAMLLIFPLCGLVIGGGNFVSRLILVSNGAHPDFMLALAAMLAGIVPFFFVPSLLKGSMNILGNIGSKLGGLSKVAGSKARSATANTDRFKEIQQQSRLKADKARAARLNARIAAAGGNASERLKRKAGVINQRVAQGEALNTKNASWGSATRLKAAQQGLERQDEEAAIQDNMTLISNDKAFDAEDGESFYNKMVAARDAGNDAEADAYIEMAMKNGKAAAKFMEKMRTDSSRVLDRKSASRIMRGSNTGILKAVDGIGYQYAREIDTGKVSGVNAAAWSSNIDNIKTAIEKNINNSGAYASQSASVHEVLNNNKTRLATAPAGSSGVSGVQLVNELEYYAAEAAETSADASKIAVYNRMRENSSLPGGIRQTRAREAQEAQTATQVAATTAQTAAINAAAATASADAAAIQATQATQVAQAQVQFRQQHMAMVEAKRRQLGPNATIIPEGYTAPLGESNPTIYRNADGSVYDSQKNEFH